MRRTLVLFCGLFAIANCRTMGSGEDKSTALDRSLREKYLPPANVTLGMGVDTDLSESKDVCIQNGAPDSGDGNTKVTYMLGQVSQSTVDSYGITGSMDAKATYMDLASANMTSSMDFGKSNAQGTYTIDMAATYQTGVAKVTDSSLKESMRGLLKNPELFRRKCGDSYVKNLAFGGRLVASVILEFSNKDRKLEFANKAGVSGKMSPKMQGEVSRTIGFTWGSANLWDKVTVVVSQVGGDLSLVSTLLGQSNQDGKVITQCNAKDFQKCREFIDKILNAPEAYKAFQAKPANITYQVATYPEAPPVVMDREKQAARNALLKTLEVNEQDLERAEDLLNNPDVVGYQRAVIVDRIKPTIEKNIPLLKKALRDCDQPNVNPAPPCLEPPQVKGVSEYWAADKPFLKSPQLQGSAGHIGSDVGSAGALQQCFPGYSVGVRGTSGEHLDQVGLVCQGPSDMGLLGNGHEEYVASKARKVRFVGPNEFKVLCDQANPNNWVLTGIRGNTEIWKGAKVTGALGIYCTHLSVLKGESKNTNLKNRFVPIFQTNQPGQRDVRCAEGFALRAWHVQAGDMIDSIRIDCVQVPHTPKK